MLANKEPPPARLLPWLLHTSSLTEKLKKETGEAKLTVLSQQWCAPNWWDRYVLDLAESQVLHRDIVMSTHELPCWYARTIIPETSYKAHETFFSRLEKESLGAIIYNTEGVRRDSLLYYAIDRNCLEFYWFSHKEKDETLLWGRRSILYCNKGTPFFLMEIFLPGLLKVIS